MSVAEDLNFRKAAERLNISRPALSKQVKDLEEEMGVRLLDRDTVKVSLTKAGEVFLDDARRILRMTRHAVERAHEAHHGQRGKLRIASMGVISANFLPETLRAFRRKYPAVEVSFAEMVATDQIQALETGKIDIAFAFGKSFEETPGLSSLSVVETDFGVAVSHANPLSRLAEPVSLARIAAEPALCIGDPSVSRHRDAFQRVFASFGGAPKTLRVVEGYDSLVTLVAADQGVTLLPRVMDLSMQRITILTIDAPAEDLSFQLFAVWRRHASSLTIRHFLDLLAEQVASD